MNIIRFKVLDSTNIEAQKKQYKHGDIIVADFQTKGRGLRGNVWRSQEGVNLMFSLVGEFKVAVSEQFYVSMVAALAAKDAICEIGLDCRIKWSNDLYVGDCKIGGILIEHHSMGEFLTKSVIGIGINVGQVEFDDKIPNPTSCALKGLEVSVDKVLENFVEAFLNRIGQSCEELHIDFMSSLWRKDGVHKFYDGSGEFLASITDVDKHTGELTLLDIDGLLRNYWFKEVEFAL